MLLERPGEVVTREQLIARLWPKGVVEFDTGLNSAMRKLRIALGDEAIAVTAVAITSGQPNVASPVAIIAFAIITETVFAVPGLGRLGRPP